jgi:hypothetical protein
VRERQPGRRRVDEELAGASIGIERLIDHNPGPLDTDALERILDAAWHGEPARLSRALA